MSLIDLIFVCSWLIEWSIEWLTRSYILYTVVFYKLFEFSNTPSVSVSLIDCFIIFRNYLTSDLW